jgi:transglutaminase-like putative cysteine protease
MENIVAMGHFVKWRIQHRTRCLYATPARESFNDARLKPAAKDRQRVESFSLTTEPSAPLRQYDDSYGNCVHHFEVPGSHTMLSIESLAVVAVQLPPPLDAGAAPAPLSALPDAVKSNLIFCRAGCGRGCGRG